MSAMLAKFAVWGQPWAADHAASMGAIAKYLPVHAWDGLGLGIKTHHRQYQLLTREVNLVLLTLHR